MLPRVLEPEVMDSPEEALDYDRMDHSAVNRRFAEDFLASGFNGQDILDLGTGTAQIPIAICQLHPACRIMAIDAATNMLELARYNVAVSGCSQRIQLAHVDAKRLPYRDRMFDAVISNSIVHHLPEPAPAMADAVRVTRNGGTIFFRDLLRPASLDELQQLVQTYAGNEAAHARQMFTDSLHAALTLEEVRAIVTGLGLPAGSVQRSSDRHWTWSCQKPPASHP